MKRRLSIITHGGDTDQQTQLPDSWPTEYSGASENLTSHLVEHLKKRKLSVIQPSLYSDLSPLLHLRAYFEPPTPTSQSGAEPTMLNMPLEAPLDDTDTKGTRELSQLKQLDVQVNNSKQLLAQLQQLHVRSTTMTFSEATDHLSFLNKQQDQLDQLQSIIDEHNRQILQIERQMHA